MVRGARVRHDLPARTRPIGQARTVLLAAAVHGRQAIDSVYLQIPDQAGLAAEAREAAASGFEFKACIHPAQVAVVREAFRPDRQQADWACRVLAAAAGAVGVFTIDGRMVDAPLVRQAERILDAVSHPGGTHDR